MLDVAQTFADALRTASQYAFDKRGSKVKHVPSLKSFSIVNGDKSKD